ncbi:MAG: PQQ-binding-like beta-propeller repeat protein [Calditrichaeota bacterium]|nr:PQQ-binding-like beta-propeller repeat protein [Calditrichota bacterium]
MKRLLTILFFVALILTGCQKQDRFRFAWLSDTHVSTASSGAKDLRLAVKDINRLRNIDFVIVSGDITETNTGNNLFRAKQILDSLNMPYYIIPGNHDSKWTDSDLENFKTYWGDDKFNFDYGDFKFIGLHQGPELRMADGHFAPHDLRWLKRFLRTLKNPRQPLIFVTHYPLSPPFTIDNYDVFMDIIKNYRVVMLLNGHGHRNRRGSAYGIPQIMGRSSLRASNERGGYNIVEYQNNQFTFYERITGNATMPSWTNVVLYPEPVVIDSLIIRPDFSINNQFPAVSRVWEFNADNLITASPSVFGGRVFIGDVKGIMHCLNLEDGRELWTFRSGSGIYAKAAAQSKSLVFTSADSNIYCLNPENGELLWKHKTDKPELAVPVVNGDTVFVGGSDHKFRALNLTDGTVFWEYEPINGYVETKPLLFKDKVIFGAWDQTLYALNRKTGTLAWQWKEGRPHLFYSPAACWAVAADKKVFIVAPDRFMTAIDDATGKTIWRTNLFKVRETIGISEDGSRVYAKCMRDTVFAVNTRKNEPSYLWVSDFDFGYDIANSMIREKDGIAFFGTKNGLIVAFEGKTGKLLWKHKIGNTLINTLQPLEGNKVLVSTMDGLVVLLSF